MYGELINPANFGPSGTVSCRIEFDDFVQSITTGLLVDDGVLKYDVFFLSGTYSPLTLTEASELATFLETGGVVYASEIMHNGLVSNSVNPLFVALEINDRFRTQIDNRWFGGGTSIPIETPITNGKFGVVGRLVNGQFRKMSHSSLTGISKGFEELGFVGVSPIGLSPGTNSLSDPLEFNLFEKEIDQGYLSVSGETLYVWGEENMKYFKNLFGFACRDVLGISTGPEPFLELPWDYASKGHSFTEAATSINSYFDHEYPLLSVTSLRSLHDTSLTLANDGVKDPAKHYSSHDGYDYGSDAQTKYGTPQLAAADGLATYHYGSAIGNAIYIDHGNGFQTRHYHLDDRGLVVSGANQEVNVVQGQQIGITGFSGNVYPLGEQGSHVHFMVVEDKNNDDNFNDNIPDGLVDPFGWQSPEPDPWPNFTFNYLGQDRTGNESHYLWIHELSNAEANVGEDGGSISNEKATITFPPFALDEDVKIYMESASTSDFGRYKSIGSGIRVTAKNLAGEIIDNFLQPYELQMKLTESFLENIDLSTLSIFSSEDGTNWIREDSEINMDNLTVAARLYHFSYLVVMGETEDAEPPITTINYEGEMGDERFFRSEVRIALIAEDESEILYTAYRINDEDWTNYVSPLNITDEGEHRIYYYSEDEHGNIEDENELVINIDKKFPEIRVTYNLNTKDFDYSVVDSDTEATISAEGRNNIIDNLVARDRSGNQTKLSVTMIDLARGGIYIPKNITYDTNKKSFINHHWELATQYTRQGILEKFTQHYKDGIGSYRLIIVYDWKTNKSKIIRYELDGTKIEQLLDGAHPITLKTNNGDIEFSY